MTFTYDFENAKTVARVRLAIGDTVEGSGVLPGDSNFADEEIEAILVEVSDDIDAATYIFLKSLSNTWGKFADITVGPRKESLSQISFHYARRALEMGRQTGLSGRAFSTLLRRVDGYSGEAVGDY